MEGQPYLEMLNYRTLVPSEVRLPSVPVHLGSLPDTNIAFVSQEHNLGRISFFDTDEGDLQTITGFELNSAIDHLLSNGTHKYLSITIFPNHLLRNVQ